MLHYQVMHNLMDEVGGLSLGLIHSKCFGSLLSILTSV